MLQPLGKRVLVAPKANNTTGTNGVILHLPDSKKPTVFIVLAIGDEVTKVNVDDTIYIGQYSTTTIMYEGEEAMLVIEDAIVAKVAKESANA